MPAMPGAYFSSHPGPPRFGSPACASGRHDPDLWTSDEPTGQRRAAAICLGCPHLEPCRQWAVTSAPYLDRAVYGGLTWKDRLRIRRERRERDQARREARRRTGRQSEARRRLLGKTPTTAERYAANPEPFKARASAYYQAHREAVLERKRERDRRRREAAASPAA